MKLAISNIAWLPQEEEAVFEKCLHYGFEALEIAPTKLFENPYDQSDEAIIKEREQIEAKGLKVVAMQALLFGKPELKLFGSEETREELAHYLKAANRFAAVIGATSLVFGSPKNRLKGELEDQVAIDIAADFFNEIGEDAKAKGVVFCLEPNPKEYAADFMCETEDAIQFVKAINNDGFKVNLDMSTLTLNKESLNRIEEWMPYINHIHISEPFLEAIPQVGTDHQEFARQIKLTGYDGYCSIEMKTLSQTSNIQSIEKALERVKHYYG